jgi:hypothetical protein
MLHQTTESPVLTCFQKWRICVEYAARMTLFTDKLSGAMTQELVNITGYCARTIRNVWKEFTNQRNNAFDVPVDLEPKIKGHSEQYMRTASRQTIHLAIEAPSAMSILSECCSQPKCGHLLIVSLQKSIGKRRRADSDEIQQGIKTIINEKGGDITYRAVHETLHSVGYDVSVSTVHRYCHIMNVKDYQLYKISIIRRMQI